ncbi:type 2 lantibiotic [Butyrivibrio sp. XB500-5]|nr:type 2 lantibiotic [Butyrivibrio sp. XB500-5]
MIMNNERKERFDKIVGLAFENMSAEDMARLQGAGDVDGEGFKGFLETAIEIISFTASAYDLSKGLADSFK